jgi:hypothetical protein
MRELKLFSPSALPFSAPPSKIEVLSSYLEKKKFFLLEGYLQKVYRRELPEHIFV